MHFSITRLILATTVFAIAFGAFGYLGAWGIVASSMSGLAGGLICLVVKPDQIWPMFRTGLLTIASGAIGFTFCPRVRPPYSPGNELKFIGLGMLFGFIIGVSMTALQRLSKPAEPTSLKKKS